MRMLLWTRVVRTLALTAAAAVAVFGIAYLVAPVLAASACGEGQVSAVYYNWVAAESGGGSWQEVKDQCEAAPLGGTFSRDFSSGLPEGVDSSRFKVEYTGNLGGTPGSWYQFSAGGDTATLTVTVDGLAVIPDGAPYVALNERNTFALTFEGAGTSNFAVTWTETATTCTPEEILAVYALTADRAREARVVRCEPGPIDHQLQRTETDLPTLDVDYRASYTVPVGLGHPGWNQFQASGLGDGDSLAVAGEAMPASSDQPRYLELNPADVLPVTYTHTGAGSPGFTLQWSPFGCNSGLFLAAYYVGADSTGWASALRCEPMPEKAALLEGKSAKWTGTRYFEGGTYTLTVHEGLTYSLDGGPEKPMGDSTTAVTEAVTEGLHQVAFRFRKDTGPVTVTVTNGHTKVALPPCPEGAYARTGPGLAPTCEAAPLPGAGAVYKGRLWFQGGQYAVSAQNLSALAIDGKPVTGNPPIAEGTHDVSFTATSASSAPGLAFALRGGCPEGTFRSEYQAGGVSFSACEARPDYIWSTPGPPGIDGAYTASWTGEVPLAELGLHKFAASGDFTLQVRDNEGNLQNVSRPAADYG
ncbi:MAG TPA: hypothetical protein VD902_14060 [Symbiobacteriaceae bacterium]|nr:hypothetical protein [Symbiobacteriaceae bacterium]